MNTAPLAILLVTSLPIPGQSDNQQKLREEGRALLVRLGAKHTAKTLRASYVQERTSLLVTKPLVSNGRLFFQAEPSCIVFRVEKPRLVTVRLDTKVYEVHRPTRKRLERYHLPSTRLPQALFQALSPRIREIERDFRITRVTVDGKGEKRVHRIELIPRDAAARQYLDRFRVSVRTSDAALTEVRYRDPQGDLVTLRLTDIELDPKLPKGTFTIDAPSGTKTIEHRPKPKKPRRRDRK